MNLSALNGASINGTSVPPIVNAEASISAAASVVAGATYIHEALGAGSGVAAVSADATRTQYASALLPGEGNVYAAQTLIHAGAATVAASAEVVAYLVRVIYGDAVFSGTAFFEAIPASILGAANVVGSAEISCVATKILPGVATAVGGGEIAASPYVIRNVDATISGVAMFRPEGSQNKVQDGFCDIWGSAEISIADSGILFNIATAAVECTAVCSGSATLMLSGRSDISSGAEVSALPVNIVAGQSDVFASASLSPDATRFLLPSSGVVAGCIISAASSQRHATGASASCTAEIVPILALFRGAKADIKASGGLIAIAFNTKNGSASISGIANLIAQGRSNADAKDPEDRTARRPFVDTNMRRPYTETTIRRAA